MDSKRGQIAWMAGSSSAQVRSMTGTAPRVMTAGGLAKWVTDEVEHETPTVSGVIW